MSNGKYRKDHTCLNCGHHVEHHYCSSCGQPNLELKESFWAFIGHSIAHYFHFDSKFFQTLEPLLTKPGLITQEYLSGKRARYINPVNLYIFVSIVYFLIVPAARDKHIKKDHNEITVTTPATIDNLTHQFQDKDANGVIQYGINAAKAVVIKDNFKKMSFTRQQTYLDSLKRITDTLKAEPFEDLIESLEKVHIIKQDSTFEAYLLRQQKLPENRRDNWFKRQSKKRDIIINAKSAKGDWTIGDEIKKYQPKQYFLLMPLLAFFIMISFRKNQIYYLDHLIFTIHGMTAYFIVSIIFYPIVKYVFGIDSMMGDLIEYGIIAWICWYLYTGLRVFYNRPKGKTIGKMVGLFFLYTFSLYITESLVRNFIYYFMT
ncbi:MAG: DUF3667 domain-containing protein [Bacteroidota bacterium]